MNRLFGGDSHRPPSDDASYAAARTRMVETQLRGRGIRSPSVLAAMAAVPRQAFVPVGLRALAYADEALPIEHGQTISQPLMVALMTELLEPEPGSRVLEIGTGSGYQAAVLAAMGCLVTSVERVPELAATARERLAALGFGDRVEVRVGDGSASELGGAAEPGDSTGESAPTGKSGPTERSEAADRGGAAEPRGVAQLRSAAEPGDSTGESAPTGKSGPTERSEAADRGGAAEPRGVAQPGDGPWPRIIVAAAAPDVPAALLARLADGGRLVIPVGSRHEQELLLVERDGSRLRTTRHGPCIFVPLIGEGGFR